MLRAGRYSSFCLAGKGAVRPTTPRGSAFPAAAAGLICLALAACATAPTVKTVCPAIRLYQPADVAALTAELKTIDRHGPVAQAVVEYRRLRDELRACQATQ